MSDSQEQKATLTVKSVRFGDMVVPADSVMEFAGGLIGFPRHKNFVMFDYKAPFAWLHSVEDSNLAFVVMDGSQFTTSFEMKPPYGDRETDLKESDEYAILVVVTVRADAQYTTANLKAPLFVNLRNRKGVQVIYDNPKYPTRYHLWGEPAVTPESSSKEGEASPSEPEKKE